MRPTASTPPSPGIVADIFDFPVGKPRSLGGSGFVTERNDGDGWYNAQDFGEYDPKVGGYHPGEDWNTEAGGDSDIGEPVYAVANGIVYAKRTSVGEGLGGGIVIKHLLPEGSEVYSVYVHIEPNQSLSVGQVVARGEKIGTIADIKYPAHLHFEIRTKPVNPDDWYPNDIEGTGYYASVEKMREDGFTVDPSYFIASRFGGTPGIPSRFKIGDWVQTTANLNVREGPGVSYTIISTMPKGTVGRVVAGPLEADGYIWWEVNYVMDRVTVVIGWSAENWLELYPLPLCSVKLQKAGVEINEIGVGEFFDICVGVSSTDKPIKAVRFSSDDSQDGIPTGEWTTRYDWSVSSGDWDAMAKIKRWAFTTPGFKEVWAEVIDESGYSAACFAKIFVLAPALPILTSPLLITPAKDVYNVGDLLQAEFTVKNIGDKPITLSKLLVGGRFNGGKLPNGEFPDFAPQTSITLQPDQSYQYKGSLTLTRTGNYHFFIAYHIENPTPEEKKLLDENNWNTNIALAEWLSHKDRVRRRLTAGKKCLRHISTLQTYSMISRLVVAYPNPGQASPPS
jgi:hypothetical protein